MCEALRVLFVLIGQEQLRFDSVEVASSWNLEQFPEIKDTILNLASQMEELQFREKILGYEWGEKTKRKSLDYLKNQTETVLVILSDLEKSRLAWELLHSKKQNDPTKMKQILVDLGFTLDQARHIRVEPDEKRIYLDDGYGGKLKTDFWESNKLSGLVDVSSSLKQSFKAFIRAHKNSKMGTESRVRYSIAVKAFSAIEASQKRQIEDIERKLGCSIDLHEPNVEKIELSYLR